MDVFVIRFPLHGEITVMQRSGFFEKEQWSVFVRVNIYQHLFWRRVDLSVVYARKDKTRYITRPHFNFESDEFILPSLELLTGEQVDFDEPDIRQLIELTEDYYFSVAGQKQVLDCALYNHVASRLENETKTQQVLYDWYTQVLLEEYRQIWEEQLATKMFIDVDTVLKPPTEGDCVVKPIVLRTVEPILEIPAIVVAICQKNQQFITRWQTTSAAEYSTRHVVSINDSRYLWVVENGIPLAAEQAASIFLN